MCIYMYIYIHIYIQGCGEPSQAPGPADPLHLHPNMESNSPIFLCVRRQEGENRTGGLL